MIIVNKKFIFTIIILAILFFIIYLVAYYTLIEDIFPPDCPSGLGPCIPYAK